MGLLDGVLGNASKIDAAKVQQEFAQILASGEKVEHAYQLIRARVRVSSYKWTFLLPPRECDRRTWERSERRFVYFELAYV